MATKTRNHPLRMKNGNIELMLTENMSNLGEQGEIVAVKPGYARNYLLPRGLATIATEANKARVEQHKARQAEVQAKKTKALKDLANSVGRYSVTIEANAQPDGALFGSIQAPEISKQLKSAGYEVDPDHIKLEGPLRELGMYTVDLEFAETVKTEVKVWVVPKAGTSLDAK